MARALIAHHALKAEVVKVTELATLFRLSENAVYVARARWKKVVPDLMAMPTERFVDPTLEPPAKLIRLGGRHRKSARAAAATSDAEIGRRLADQLPLPDTN
jgi:hypothetical protein